MKSLFPTDSCTIVENSRIVLSRLNKNYFVKSDPLQMHGRIMILQHQESHIDVSFRFQDILQNLTVPLISVIVVCSTSDS